MIAYWVEKGSSESQSVAMVLHLQTTYQLPAYVGFLMEQLWMECLMVGLGW